MNHCPIESKHLLAFLPFQFHYWMTTQSVVFLASFSLKQESLFCNTYGFKLRYIEHCTNQQPPQRGGAVPGPIWVGSKWLLAFPRIPVLHHSTAASTWWCGPRPRLGWVEMAVGLPEGPSYPGHSPFIFSLCCPLNDRRRAAHSIFKIGRLFLLFLLSCPPSSPHSSSSPDER